MSISVIKSKIKNIEGTANRAISAANYFANDEHKKELRELSALLSVIRKFTTIASDDAGEFELSRVTLLEILNEAGINTEA